MRRTYDIKNVFSADFGSKSMIADVDMKSRTVTGYFSRFGNKDSDGDIMLPNSLTKTVKERGWEGKNIIPHILDHDIHVTLKQLAKPKIYEKSDGGFFESTITDTQNGTDTLKLYRDGVINQHSFGFKIIQKENKENTRFIKEVLLYEISTVTLGANEDTPFTGFKSMSKPELIERYKTLKKAFDTGDYSDEIFPALDAQIKQIESDLVDQFIYKSNETTEPLKANTLPEIKDYQQVNNYFKQLFKV